MAELKRLRVGRASDQCEHTTALRGLTETVNRHTAMHRETGVQLAGLKLDVFSLKGGVEQIIGMLDTVIEQGRER